MTSYIGVRAGDNIAPCAILTLRKDRQLELSLYDLMDPGFAEAYTKEQESSEPRFKSVSRGSHPNTHSPLD